VVEACVILVLVASKWVGGKVGFGRSLNRGGPPQQSGLAAPDIDAPSATDRSNYEARA
jgi:hypothetical protein